MDISMFVRTNEGNRPVGRIGKMYSLEYTDIPKVFFTPLPVGHCCTNVIPGNVG
jgi:hypothetical protein